MTEMDWKNQRGSGPVGYDEFLVPAMFAPFAERLVEHAGIGAGMRVLDVACGTGAVSRAAARLVGASGSVTGADLGEPTLEVARSRASEDGCANVEYLQADATSLPLGDGLFDVVLCQQGLQFFPDRKAALVEMRRVLKPGGRLAIATWKDIEHSPFIAVEESLGRHLGAEAARMMRSPFSLHEAAELNGALMAAGFSEIEVFDETISCTWPSHSQFAPLAIAASPMAVLFDDLPEQVRSTIAEEVAERLAPHAAPDDRLCMAMTSNVALARS